MNEQPITPEKLAEWKWLCEHGHDDWYFCSIAVVALPRLIAEVERLNAENERMKR